ncbi:hypothetical protein M1L60_35465 [Actinoplanes sp. TRM 88003]|uniref:Uncharacterized protein n=1 Tax=Paractinoplanes aksuensis TaxID=2939490 RepID=A0ABT1E239_9ACTN|nr:hypothetical protein [Actinoplanes aksuensis]MCO8275891.1 hypothetical protein [Actinoplanes aksuensis]
MSDATTAGKPSYAPVIGLIVLAYVLATSITERICVALVLVVQIGTVWYVLRLASIRPHLRRAATGVFVLALVSAGWAVASPTNCLVGLTFLAGCVLYAMAPLVIVADVARRAADKELLLGALAAYLMLGLAFGFAY